MRCLSIYVLAVLSTLVAESAFTPVQARLIAGGAGHTCALTDVGGVMCWGANHSGQLGDGTATGRLTPVFAFRLKRGAGAVVAGWLHTCALVGGGVKCWGANNKGQLGDGTKTDRNIPTFVKGLKSGVIAIAAGHFHTCAVTDRRKAMCWGENRRRQLGDGTAGDQVTPVPVKDFPRKVIAMAAGSLHTCALLSTGRVKCWGDNDFGQLGNGATDTFPQLPVDVIKLGKGTTAIAARGEHTCARLDSNSAKCWGANSQGLGNGTSGGVRPTPLQVKGLPTGVAAIAAGHSHTCFLTATAGVRCTGSNLAGQIGDGTFEDRLTAVAVKRLKEGVAAIGAGFSHSCALIMGGGAKCWGNNFDGQLGDGTKNNSRNIPVRVKGFK